VVLAVPALAAAAVVPDASDVAGGAQPIELLPAGASEVVERPGDQDWYTIFGRNPDDSVNSVFVRVLEESPSCPGPLKVALFNPERRWMRTAQATRGNVATVLVPGLTSRYLLDVSSTDAACSGLEYEVTYVSTDRPKPDSKASKCVIARAARIDAQDRLEMLQKVKPQYSPDAHPRYDRYIARAKATLAAARKAVRRACT